MVADEELSSEEPCHARNLQPMPSLLRRLNLILLRLQFFELRITHCVRGAKLEDLFTDDSILEERSLLDKLIADFAHRNRRSICFLLSITLEFKVALNLFQNRCNSGRVHVV